MNLPALHESKLLEHDEWAKLSACPGRRGMVCLVSLFSSAFRHCELSYVLTRLFLGSGIRCQIEKYRFRKRYFGRVQPARLDSLFVPPLRLPSPPLIHPLHHARMLSSAHFRTLHLLNTLDSQHHFSMHTPIYMESMPDERAFYQHT